MMKQKWKRFLKFYHKEFVIGIASLCVCLLCLGILLPKPRAKTNVMDSPIDLEPIAPIEEPKELDSVIRVDLKGAVANPGVYEMRTTARVNDVIYQAGGVTENADLSRINLSKRVTDEMVIIVYTKEEIAALKNEQTKVEYVYIEPDCSCPDSVNDACIEPKKEELQTKISLNKATKEQLEALPGIGASKADAIIAYREKKLFETIDELKEIKGIGDAVFEKLKDYITL